MTHSYGRGARLAPRGPYGTNKGDIWLMGSYFQDRIRADKGPGWRAVAEMIWRDGAVVEAYYATDNPEIVAAADLGHERWLAAQAARN
jgi:hypothetical protein